MRRRVVLLLLVLWLAALSGGPLAAAAFGAPDPALVDCTAHNGLTRHYSVGELRHALGSMSADVKEYTSCADILQRALDDQLGGLHVKATGSSSSGGGGFLPTPLIVVLVLAVLTGAGFGVLSLRRRGEASKGPPERL